MEFKKDDFMANSEWVNEADVVFANATCFEQSMVSSISKILNAKLKKGGVVIFTTKSLECEEG